MKILLSVLLLCFGHQAIIISIEAESLSAYRTEATGFAEAARRNENSFHTLEDARMKNKVFIDSNTFLRNADTSLSKADDIFNQRLRTRSEHLDMISAHKSHEEMHRKLAKDHEAAEKYNDKQAADYDKKMKDEHIAMADRHKAEAEEYEKKRPRNFLDHIRDAVRKLRDRLTPNKARRVANADTALTALGFVDEPKSTFISRRTSRA